MTTLTQISLQAMSLAVPQVERHPNRLAFNGILTRVGIASDSAPSGSGGKRILITAEAAEQALPSLLGMAINLADNASSHAPSTGKIGLITDAHVEADAIKIGGFIYAADHPNQARKILAEQADLGFSFEARNITVDDGDADPLVIRELCFVGASVLLKSAAAYKTTRLAAMAAMAAIEKETIDVDNTEFKATLSEALGSALAPVNEAIVALQSSQQKFDERLGSVSEALMAQQALTNKVDPIAVDLEKQAEKMEASGVGDASILRRMASAMRADAAAGRMPQAFTPTVPAAPQQVAPQPVPAVAFPRFEDTDAYKTMQAAMDKLSKDLATANDQIAASETRVKDMKATADASKPAPDRKTLPPIIANLMAKGGVELPDDGSVMSVHKLDKVLASSGLSIADRTSIKTGLNKAGMIPLNSNPAQ